MASIVNSIAVEPLRLPMNRASSEGRAGLFSGPCGRLSFLSFIFAVPVA
jgi:hypothetical protein